MTLQQNLLCRLNLNWLLKMEQRFMLEMSWQKSQENLPGIRILPVGFQELQNFLKQEFLKIRLLSLKLTGSLNLILI